MSQEQTIPLDIAGSSSYGRDPKMMASRTFNMILADGWYVDYAGIRKVDGIAPQSKGRGIFTSTKANKLIEVIGNKVYSTTVYSASSSRVKTYSTEQIGTLNTFTGDVSMDENNANEIAICDQNDLWIYNHVTTAFTKATLPSGLLPGYVTFQNTYFIVPDRLTSEWALSAPNNGLSWLWGAGNLPVKGALQTKGDFAQAVLRVPGAGNLILVFGKIVTELWTGVPQLFPFQRSSSINIDYGCINPATIAASDKLVAWLAQNEKSGPVIMYMSGAEAQQVSTDGINFRFSQLVAPEKSVGFFVKLAGHLVYQLTFYDPADNYTLLYDFTTQKFFDATDEKMNYHPARHMAFFDNGYYFVSLNDGNLYEFSEQLSSLDYGEFHDGSPKVYEIQRIRVCSNMRRKTSARFVVSKLVFTLEQGNDTNNNGNDPGYNPRVILSVSVDGGVSFGGGVSYPIERSGKRINQISFYKLGSANDFVTQFRFYGLGPIRATDGEATVYQ